jgi:hypothetical protein
VKSAAALAACLILAGATAVLAQPPGEQRGPEGRRGPFDPTQLFDRLDENKDGQVSKAEFDQGFARFRQERQGDREGRQESRREGRPGGRRGEGAPNWADRFHEGMLDRIKEQLEATDKEWEVLKPRVEKVMDTQRAMRPSFRGNDDNAPPEAEALRKAIEDKKTSPETLKSKMEALRAARKKQEAELEAARAALREVLTARQEAAMVLNTLLD